MGRPSNLALALSVWLMGCSPTSSQREVVDAGNGIGSNATSDGSAGKQDRAPLPLDGATSCSAGVTRECFTGPEAARGIGRCRAGTQRCESGGTWVAACMGEILPAEREECGNGLDDDCNGMVDEACGGCPSDGGCDGGGQAPPPDAGQPPVGMTPPAAARGPHFSGGFLHSCALRKDGSVWCWGANMYGQLGDGTTGSKSRPVAVMGATGMIRLESGSYHTCAQKSTGPVFCWGRSQFGQVGDGTKEHRNRPLEIMGLDTVVSIGLGWEHSCAALADGRVLCWGVNSAGGVGDGTTEQRSRPTPVMGINDAVEVGAGYRHSCARRRDGTVACWGSSSHGQIGDGSMTNRPTPVAVVGLSDVIQIAAGDFHNCALRKNGTVMCWGRGERGTRGDGTTVEKVAKPVESVGVSDVVQIGAGHLTSWARRRDGTVLSWGTNKYNDMGIGGSSFAEPRAKPVKDVSDAMDIGGGGHHACVVKAAGGFYCWGRNDNGQVGNGGGSDQGTPVKVLDL